MRIGIDLLGGERPAKELFPAVVSVAESLDPSDTLCVFITEEVKASLDYKDKVAGIQWSIVSETVTMDDNPLTAVRRKKDSSMAVGLRDLAAHTIDAFVSPGNTGALVANAVLSLPFLPGIEKVALLALIPNKKSVTALLDVGASASCSAAHILQFACMGAVYQRITGCHYPKLGLLNMGTEEQKGTEGVREAFRILQRYAERESQGIFDFCGNIEGTDLFDGQVDVVVTDGFTGNIFLKASEGSSQMVLQQMAHVFGGSPEQSQLLEDYRLNLAQSIYAGAVLCGLDGIVIKCHGACSAPSLKHAIQRAIALIKGQFLRKMEEALLSTCTN